MKEQGFTLVELLAVIVILSLIAMISVPAITAIIKQGKESLSDSQKNNVVLAAKNWATDIDNISKLPEDGSSKCVTLSTLQNGGYADLEIKDPKTGNPLNVIVTITRDGKNLTYEVSTQSIGSCY